MDPLVEEATKKAAVAWLTVPGGHRAFAVWCLWLDGALYLVGGPGEQPAPGLPGAPTVDVTVRGDHGGQIVTWPATVARVAPDSEEWSTVAPQLAGKRLNAPTAAEDTVRRWATECVVYRLTPAADPIAAGPTLPDDSGATPPPPSPASRRTANPFRLHRVRRPR
jgi:hypothetical protein